MTPALILSLVGLALVDSVNVSTIWIVVLLVLTVRRPAPTGAAYTAGAFLTFLTFTLLLYFGASVAQEWMSDLTQWLQREFNRSLQHRPFGSSVVVPRTPRPECASQGSCEVGC
jgi:hypothetical protein